MVWKEDPCPSWKSIAILQKSCQVQQRLVSACTCVNHQSELGIIGYHIQASTRCLPWLLQRTKINSQTQADSSPSAVQQSYPQRYTFHTSSGVLYPFSRAPTKKHHPPQARRSFHRRKPNLQRPNPMPLRLRRQPLLNLYGRDRARDHGR